MIDEQEDSRDYKVQSGIQVAMETLPMSSSLSWLFEGGFCRDSLLLTLEDICALEPLWCKDAVLMDVPVRGLGFGSIP